MFFKAILRRCELFLISSTFQNVVNTHFVVQSCYVNSKDMEEAEYLLNALSDVRSYFFDKLKDLVSIFKYTLITRSLCWSTLFSRNSLTNKYEGRPPAWGCLRLRFLRFG